MVRRFEAGLVREWRSLIVGLLVMAACVVAIVSFQLPQLRQLESGADLSVAEVNQAVEAERLQLQVLQRMPAFGFDNLLSDWAFLRFLQYFGDEPARSKTDYRLSPEFFEVVIGRNPNFLLAYTFLSTSTSIYAGKPERTIAIAQRGIESLGQINPQALTTPSDSWGSISCSFSMMQQGQGDRLKPPQNGPGFYIGSQRSSGGLIATNSRFSGEQSRQQICPDCCLDDGTDNGSR
ncbi:hypothetical protein [Egbenema bharatensis]|uniref:hypothetical protein n=1 Tax=Egbenema bharatensis TaxID=3463334 RepID=UPI003A85CF94